MATIIKLNGKDYEIKFGYGIVAQTDIVEKIMNLGKVFEDTSENSIVDNLNYIVSSLAEFVLAGLQKNYRDEFGYDYKTNEGKDEKLSLVYDMLDDYFDDGGEFAELFEKVQSELMNNGFLAKMLQTEETQNSATKTKSKK